MAPMRIFVRTGGASSRSKGWRVHAADSAGERLGTDTAIDICSMASSPRDSAIDARLVDFRWR